MNADWMSMIGDSQLLGRFWLAVIVHLWQTTLILVPLFFVARAMRNAPASLVNGLWTMGFVKVFVPLAVLLPAARRVLLPLLEQMLPSAFGPAGTSVWLERARVAIDPTVLAVSGNGDGLGLAPLLLRLVTVLWVGGMISLGVRWIRTGKAQPLDGAVGIREVAKVFRKRVLSALDGTGVPWDAILIVPGSAMPAVVGLVRRRIVISEAMIGELSEAELRAILLHENQHRRRWDPLRSLIQRCVLAVFFFYPLLWVVLGRLTSSTEIACDEAAIRGGIAPQAYARALARTVSMGLLPSHSPAGIGSRTSSLLHQRLSRLSNNRRYVTM
jgi:Zn-dependent protease with chaperone function